MAAITSGPSRSALIYGEDLKGAFHLLLIYLFTKKGISDLDLFTVTQIAGRLVRSSVRLKLYSQGL